MFKLIKELFSLLTHSQRKRFYMLQVLVIIMAVAEIAGVASIIPFMSLVGDMNLLNKDNLIGNVYEASGLSSPTYFVMLLGGVVLFMLFVSALISIYTTWRLSMFASVVGTEIANRLYSHYLHQNWLFHASGSSAQLTKQITSESGRVTGGVLLPLMQMNAKLVMALMMSVAIFSYDPAVAITGILMFSLAYFGLYKSVKSLLHRNGETISASSEKRFRLMNEGFGGIKDVLLLGRRADFIKRFNQSGDALAQSQGLNNTLASVPRYFMELVVFGAMIALVIYLIASHEGNLGLILPILSVYALAGFKLLPAFQQIYSSVATIKGNASAFESIQQDLKNSIRKVKRCITAEATHQNMMTLQQQIKLENITFAYPGKASPALNDLSLTIRANSVIGVVGASGSGKSTLIDVLLGLIQPQQGQLKIDRKSVV